MSEFLRKSLGCICLFLASLGLSLHAQTEDPCKFIPTETEKKSEVKKDSSKISKWKFVQKHQFDFAFNGNSRNETSKAVCKLSASSRLAFELKYNHNQTSIEANFSDELSANVLFDSTFEKQNDLVRIKITAEHNTPKENFKKSASAQLSTQKLPTKKNGSSTIESALLSPAEVILAFGMNIKLNTKGSVECGIGSLKLSWIDQKSLYDLHQTQELHGIPRSKSHKLEGGISIQSQWQKPITKNITWENKSLVFSSFNQPGVPNLELRNDFLLKSGKSLQTAIRSIYTYNKTKWPPSSFGGEIALGVMLNKD
jgi:hypothetical protein